MGLFLQKNQTIGKTIGHGFHARYQFQKIMKDNEGLYGSFEPDIDCQLADVEWYLFAEMSDIFMFLCYLVVFCTMTIWILSFYLSVDGQIRNSLAEIEASINYENLVAASVDSVPQANGH